MPAPARSAPKIPPAKKAAVRAANSKTALPATPPATSERAGRSTPISACSPTKRSCSAKSPTAAASTTSGVRRPGTGASRSCASTGTAATCRASNVRWAISLPAAGASTARSFRCRCVSIPAVRSTATGRCPSARALRSRWKISAMRKSRFTIRSIIP